MAFLSRYTTRTEDRQSLLLTRVSVVSWAVRKLRRYTTFATKIEVVLPSQAECILVTDLDCHLRLQALLIDLQAYAIVWVSDHNPWDQGEGMIDMCGSQGDTGEIVELPRVSHEDVVIRPPAPAAALTAGSLRNADFLIQFDGGAAQREGTGGYLIWGKQGELICAVGEWYGSALDTVNAAEVNALLRAMHWLQARAMDLASGVVTSVLVLGDLRLILDFCVLRARPKV